MTDRELMQQALEALEQSRVFVTTREKIKHPEGTEWYDERITALRERLAQTEQRPPNCGTGFCSCVECLFEPAQPEQEKAMLDAVVSGTGVMLDGKRIDLATIYKQPEQEPVAWIEEARAIAAQCWCESETRHLVMNPVLAEAIARRIAGWMETGAFHARNEEYWRDHALKAEADTSPQPRQWQGLTDEELQKIYEDHRPYIGSMITAVAAKLREKNGGNT